MPACAHQVELDATSTSNTLLPIDFSSQALIGLKLSSFVVALLALATKASQLHIVRVAALSVMTPGHLTETERLALRVNPLPLTNSLARMLATECLPDPGKRKEVLHDAYLTSFLVHTPGPGLEDL